VIDETQLSLRGFKPGANQGQRVLALLRNIALRVVQKTQNETLEIA
jgi:hypothetical protein